GHHFAHRRDCAGAAGRTVGIERLDLGADAPRGVGGAGPARHADAYFVRRYVVPAVAVQGIDADEIGPQLGDRHAGHREPRAHDVDGEAAARFGIAAAVADLAFADEAVAVADRHLEPVGR